MMQESDDLELLAAYQARKIDEMATELERMRKTRLELCDRNLELEATVDRVKNLAASTLRLRGDGYEVIWEDNSGRILSRPRARAREDWIRSFAASVAACPELSCMHAADFAFGLWDELEQRFEAERQGQKPEPIEAPE